MVMIGSDEINSFTVDNMFSNAQWYSLHHEMHVLVGDDGKLEADLAIADNNERENHDAFFETLTFAQSIGLEVIVATDPTFGEGITDAERDLLGRLEPFKELVQPGFQRFFEGGYREVEFIQLITQCSRPEEINQFLERVLRVVLRKAEGSTAYGTTPNYRIRVPKLLESIGTYINREVHVQGLPEVIAGFTGYGDTFSNLIGNTPYVNAIVQPNGSSFTYDSNIKREVKRLTKGIDDDVERSREIFDWVTANIRYGAEKRKAGVGYRGALQVYRDREGVCGESASLQVTMERLAGNIAFLVGVDDFLPEKHGCTAHVQPNGQVILIDTTNPNGFDVQYKKFRILSDEHSLAGYR